MKKLVRLSAVVALLVACLFVMTACGNKDEKKDNKTDLKASAGTYEGKYTKLVGDETKNEDEKFYLELKEDGTGVHHRDDYEFKVTWKLDGDKFEMSETFVGDPIIYKGTLKDGKLDIFNGDEKDPFTYEYVYEKK